MARQLLVSSAYLPPVDYLLALAQCQHAYLEAHEHYQKQTYRNRCLIGTAQGPLSLVIPVIRPAGHLTPIGDVRVDYSTRWVDNHLRSLHAAYGKCPFFPHYIDGLTELLHQRHVLLLGLNEALLTFLMGAFGLRTTVERTTSYTPNPEPELLDLRTAFHPKHPRPPVPEYYQPFDDRLSFMPNLSAVDLLFCEGPTGLALLWAERAQNEA